MCWAAGISLTKEQYEKLKASMDEISAAAQGAGNASQAFN
jgi:hypothetical protein